MFRSATPDLLSEDMAMERERRRWEEEVEEKLDRPVGPIHYEQLRQGGELAISLSHSLSLFLSL